jgi:O-antigen/teichoic acid export membrane protein
MKANLFSILADLGHRQQWLALTDDLRSLSDRMDGTQRQELTRLINASALILGRVSASGLGFLTWLITARLFATHQVGIASGVVSAMMLCVQLALIGVGAALIRLYADHQDRPARIVNTALSIVTVTALITGLVFLLLSSTLFQELRVVSAAPLYALLFLAMVLFGTVNVLLDHVSIAIRRASQVLTRNILFGITAILMVAGLPLLMGANSSIAIVSAWVAAGLAACSFGIWHLVRSLPGYRMRAQADRSTAAQLIRVGLPNYLLTLAERAPNWILPILVIELLSPTDNAHWYVVWMMAWVAFLVPISIGQNLFAEISQRKRDFQLPVRRSLQTALVMGTAAVIVTAVAAPWLLALMGREYAEAGALPLRILVLAVIPAAFVQMYYAICRGTQRLREATITGVLSGLAGLGAAVYFGMSYGIAGMALAWLVIQSLAGIWAAARIRMLLPQFMPAASGYKPGLHPKDDG